jgi:deoxyribodipyrimidine photolyase-related protein
MPHHYKSIKLILGDQLNELHPWFDKVDDDVLFVLMEVRSETDYVKHHIQKVVAIFDAMRKYAEVLITKGHQVKYFKINDSDNQQSFTKNLYALARQFNVQEIHYQLPDEYRVDKELSKLSTTIGLPVFACDSEHFLTTRDELKNLFEGKKTYLMETFYRKMRVKHHVLVDSANQPVCGKWNFDQDNRKKVPKNHQILTTQLKVKDCSEVYKDILKAEIKTIGTIHPTQFHWTTTRSEALDLLEEFVEKALPLFGTLQDAMTEKHWYLYHSRLSFAMNVKLISTIEVIRRVEKAYSEEPDRYELNQIEGFIRQILGWREYMRGIYWAKIPEYATLNYFDNQRKLPTWFWTGETKMNCLKHAIDQSLQQAYAHHIQRLMITGNFALLAGIHPDEVDRWYLGIYIDAFEWVEITNTRGMSQFADGGIVGSKPYVSSASYIDKMSDYCQNCHYKKDMKIGEGACPFNSLYWNFFDAHQEKLKSNPRIGMMLNVWNKMNPDHKSELLEQAADYLDKIETL